MEPNQVIVLTVDALAAGGAGLARYEGRVVFLSGALPGETVRAEIQGTGPGGFRGRTVEVLESHPDRREPPCPLFLDCGGCQLMHVRDRAQLDLKAGAVLGDLADGVPGSLTRVRAPEAMHYRTRVRLQAGMVRGEMALGFHAARSNRLVPVDFCHQLAPRLNQSLAPLADWAAGLPLAGVVLNGLELLAGRHDEPLLLLLDLEGRPSEALKRAAAEGPDLAGGAATALSVRGRPVDSGRRGPKPAVTWCEILEPPVRLMARSGVFTQVNPGLNRLLVGRVLDLARESGPARVLDLYAGFGNFSLPLGRTIPQVVAVESSPAAVANARFNLDVNRFENIRLVKADAPRAASEMADRGDTFGLIVMDPPRSGAKGLAPRVARLRPREVLYLSCHPAALKRDLAEFRSLGFTLDELAAFDMFPQTAHLEVLARLSL
ncbi:MAG: RsmD family RNA methyltransferase [Proteobacteria bacterium]|nr:RsmD family RNA methyltransferase [Pseudomonadota bacterium]